jgi:hypothetical protein
MLARGVRPGHGPVTSCHSRGSSAWRRRHDGYTDVVTVSVRLLDERRFDPPRSVLIENDGQWWPGEQSAWRLCDDGFGWRAAVTWRQLHDYGWGRHLTSVPPERLRIPEGAPDIRT